MLKSNFDNLDLDSIRLDKFCIVRVEAKWGKRAIESYNGKYFSKK